MKFIFLHDGSIILLNAINPLSIDPGKVCCFEPQKQLLQPVIEWLSLVHVCHTL